MKSAKLEMKGIRCLEWANIPGLCYPLFAVIQLNGYTLTAQSLVRPILLPFLPLWVTFFDYDGSWSGEGSLGMGGGSCPHFRGGLCNLLRFSTVAPHFEGHCLLWKRRWRYKFHMQ